MANCDCFRLFCSTRGIKQAGTSACGVEWYPKNVLTGWLQATDCNEHRVWSTVKHNLQQMMSAPAPTLHLPIVVLNGLEVYGVQRKDNLLPALERPIWLSPGFQAKTASLAANAQLF
ncbi:MAG: hypothetical protein ACL7BU_15950 [Candidatus Phlomobacter fragariae]